MRWLPMIVLFLAGCATRPTANEGSFTRDWDTWAIGDRPVNEKDVVEVEVKTFTLVLMPPKKLNELWHAMYPGVDGRIAGFADLERRRLHVTWGRGWDVDGFPLPSLETLGHEVWHLPELGGYWHE